MPLRARGVAAHGFARADFKVRRSLQVWDNPPLSRALSCRRSCAVGPITRLPVRGVESAAVGPPFRSRIRPALVDLRARQGPDRRQEQASQCRGRHDDSRHDRNSAVAQHVSVLMQQCPRHHWLSYSSWRRHQKPVSLRPSGARSSPWYMPQRPVPVQNVVTGIDLNDR
jgi:hypothetical protein